MAQKIVEEEKTREGVYKLFGPGKIMPDFDIQATVVQFSKSISV